MNFNGPWRQGKRGPNNCPIIGTEQGMMICMLAANTNEHPEYERYANLIATAPELLEAAQAVVERWDTPNWKDVPGTATFINALRKSIAKAKGNA